MRSFSKHILFFTIAAILTISFSSNAQSKPKSVFGGGSNGTKENTFSDSIPVEISERIYTYLETSGIEGKYRIKNIENKRYFVMVPMKKEDVILVIWSNFYFDSNGNVQQKVTIISDMDDVDCAVLGERICNAIEKVIIGYKEKYNSDYEGNIRLTETSSKSYIQLSHRVSDAFGDEIYVKFDFEGNYLNE